MDTVNVLSLAQTEKSIPFAMITITLEFATPQILPAPPQLLIAPHEFLSVSLLPK